MPGPFICALTEGIADKIQKRVDRAMKTMPPKARKKAFYKIMEEIQPFRENQAAMKRLNAITKPLHEKVAEKR